MMQQFRNTKAMVDKIRADIGNRIVPELLAQGIALAARKLSEALHDRVEELRPQVLPVLGEPRVYKFPPRAVVAMVGEGVSGEVAAYRRVFQEVTDTHLKERARFLTLLRGGGIS